MDRVLEPELMDDADQARAYAEADFEEPNRMFVELFRDKCPGYTGTGAILDLGCGPGDIVVRLASAFPRSRVDGVDGSAAMLSFAESALAAGGLHSRVRFIRGLLPAVTLPRARYAAIVSNSLLHHLHQPEVLWQTVRRYGEDGAHILVMDLSRPQTPERAREIVEAYAGEEPAVLKTDFYNSLLAAFEPAEIRGQLDQAGLDNLDVAAVSDRHLAVWGRLPAA
jgi:ubiquinone/menaquinone biosynthesis C-methylase UbiE